MTAHPNDFARGIAWVLQGESLKAGCYVDHAHSLGGLREKILARLIKNETPEQYRVETGFIRDHQGRTPTNSRQIDLLVHDPTHTPPPYRWEDFVVVRWDAARAAVEVKSKLDAQRFQELLDLHESVREVDRGTGSGGIPTFGYALTGVEFETFVNYLSDAIREHRLGQKCPSHGQFDAFRNLPTCIVVQDQNYIAVTPSRIGRHPWRCCAVKFAGTADADGLETGKLIEIYGQAIEPNRATGIQSDWLIDWFNRQESSTKVHIGQDGEIHRGNIDVATD